MNDGTHHLVDAAALAKMKPGAILINTSRGAVVGHARGDRCAKAAAARGLAIDVYEEEEGLFFEDRSKRRSWTIGLHGF